MLELPIYDIFRVPKFNPLINVIFQALASKAGVKRPGEEAPQGQPGQSPVFSRLFYPSRSVRFLCYDILTWWLFQFQKRFRNPHLFG
jgi:hypothetical protein